MQDMIEVNVRLLGPAAEAAGESSLQYALAAPVTLGHLVELLCAKYPLLAAGASVLRFAINEEYAELDQQLHSGDEVAVLPPVSGGQDRLVQLTSEPFDLDAARRLVETPGSGAVVTFAGLVRPEGSPGNPLLALAYSAYEGMAVKEMQRLRRQAIQRFGLNEAAIIHRTGRVEINQPAVMIAVSSPHRDAAFEACRWLIDELKRNVTIWKQEIWTNGEATWVAGHENTRT